MDVLNVTPDTFIQNSPEVTRLIEENLHRIPSLNHLNPSSLKDLHLVQFRGMIQDMLDPEVYPETYEVSTASGVRTQNGMYRDTVVVGKEERANLNPPKSHGERRTIFVISVPAVNDWVTNFEKKQLPVVECTPTVESPPGKKRPLDEEEMDTDDGLPAKRMEIEGKATETRAVLSAEYLLNSPIPDRPSKACMVKVYSDFEKFQLNTVVDIVGFLSVDPALDASLDDCDGYMEESEVQARNPPPSLIPRIHAIKVTPRTHINPMLDSPKVLDSAEIYKDLKLALSQCLFEDTVAAEFLIAHLISTVHTRIECQPLGKCSINISNLPAGALPEYTTLLYDVIESILPASHYFPMTLENMNTHQFVPKKDYKTNKLTSGLLQLAPHTHLILDETRLAVGKVEASGVEAIRQLAELINNQRLKYNFQFYELEFETNIPVLILSEGRSMLPADCHIPLQPSEESVKVMRETFAAVKHFLQPKLDGIRQFLTQQRIAEFNPNNEFNEKIVAGYVEMRAVDPKISVQDLHDLLVLSRLFSLARGKLNMDQEMWEHTKKLEAERKSRVNLLKQKK